MSRTTIAIRARLENTLQLLISKDYKTNATRAIRVMLKNTL